MLTGVMMLYNYNNPYMTPCMNCSKYGMDFTQEAFNKALDLIQEAVQDERADELRYDYLISVAPTQEEKDIITSIRDDERNHRKWFREIYEYYTGEEIESKNGEAFVRPASYLEGISKAVFGELGALEKYRFIREGLPSRLYRDAVFRILTDEMKHATKYNYILSKNALKSNMVPMNSTATTKPSTPYVKTEKTPDEWVSYINPLVQRALAEQKAGINMEHLFQEFILSGVLVGLGQTPLQAIEKVEEWEQTGESELLAQSKMNRYYYE